MGKQRSFLGQFLAPWGWAALGVALVLAIFLAIAAYGTQTVKRLTDEGADATAQVTDKRRTQSRDSDGDTDTDYELWFSFKVDGKTQDHRREVSYSLYSKVAIGDSLPVRYWIQDPSVLEIEPGNAAFLARLGQIGAGIAGVIMLILARLGYRRAAAAVWMARHGVERQVTVTGHIDTNVQINNRSQFRATWTEANGRSGQTRLRRHEDLPAIGSQITILIDPEGRKESLWKDDL